MKTVIKGFKISSILGVLIGLIICYFAWQHNPQCEFHCNGVINWFALFYLWFSWFIIISLFGGLLINLFLYILKIKYYEKKI